MLMSSDSDWIRKNANKTPTEAPTGTPTSTTAGNRMAMDTSMSTKVEFFVSCRKLPKLDRYSQSDPFAVVYIQRNGTWYELERSETIKDTANPDFVKQFKLDYYFEEIQNLKVQVFDRDGPSNDLKKHDYIGEAFFRLGTLMGSRGRTVNLQLVNPRRKGRIGTLHIHGEEVSQCNDVLSVRFFGTKLDNKDGFFSKSDPYISASRSREDGSWVTVWKSEVIRNNLNPVWNQAVMPLQVLCNGDVHRPIKFDVLDWDRDGSSDFIGSFTASVEQLQQAKAAGRSFDLINEKKRRKKGSRYKNSGTIGIQMLFVEKRFTLLDYISGGLQLNLMIAIDFTGSNGDPRDANSLHYFNPHTLNQYQAAIQSVGEILREYDSDKKFPVFGFGAKVNGQVNHCFPINFNENDPEVFDVNGVLRAYHECLSRVMLAGPTYFTGILNEAYSQTLLNRCTQQDQRYQVLLILTDGIIQDMDQTVSAIVKASHQPLSIIIVGIGNADFRAMEYLDGDDQVLRDSRGNKAVGDIVQFVPFREYKSNGAMLAKHVLAEVPRQLVSFMHRNQIVPNPKIAVAIPPAESFRQSVSAGLYPEVPPQLSSRANLGRQLLQASFNNHAPIAQAQPQAVAQAVRLPPTAPNYGHTASAAPLAPSYGGNAAAAYPVAAATVSPVKVDALADLLNSLSLGQFYAGMKSLGVEQVSDLELLEETDLDQLGLKKIQKVKLKRALR